MLVCVSVSGSCVPDTGHTCTCDSWSHLPRAPRAAVAVGGGGCAHALECWGQAGCGPWGPLRMLCCWDGGGAGGGAGAGVSQDFGSQWELGSSPARQSGSGAWRASGCLESLRGGWASAAYKGRKRCPSTAPLLAPLGAVPSLWTPVTQAFVCPSWKRQIAFSLGKMPECWDGVSEGTGGGRVGREEGTSLRFCLVAAPLSVPSLPWASLRQGPQVLAASAVRSQPPGRACGEGLGSAGTGGSCASRL